MVLGFSSRRVPDQLLNDLPRRHGVGASYLLVRLGFAIPIELAADDRARPCAHPAPTTAPVLPPAS